MKALILGTLGKPLEEALKLSGVSYEVYTPEQLMIYVSESTSGYDRFFDARPELTEPVRLKAKDFDFVISRIGSGAEKGATILEHLTENMGLFGSQNADGIRICSNKLRTHLKLSQKGIRTPPTVWGNRIAHTGFVLKKLLDGLPAVGKTSLGSQGEGVFILESPLAANTTLQTLYKFDADILLQKFIKGVGFQDIRAIVVNGKVVSAMERSAPTGDFRANLSQGGSGRKIDLSTDDKALAVSAADAVGLSGFCGVDLLKDKDGKTYVVETNSNPGDLICTITGYNHFLPLVEFCKSKGRKSEQKQELPNSQEKGVSVNTLARNSNPFWSEADEFIYQEKQKLNLSRMPR
jgi:ribosomal protein S6--L-glutamate ligase